MSDLKDQLFGKVTGDMDVFEKLASKIPGWKGYIERQNRRDSDKLLRDTIFRRFRELEAHVSALQTEFISQGEIAYVDDLEKSAIKLRTFADRVRTAPRHRPRRHRHDQRRGLFEPHRLRQPRRDRGRPDHQRRHQ